MLPRAGKSRFGGKLRNGGQSPVLGRQNSYTSEMSNATGGAGEMSEDERRGGGGGGGGAGAVQRSVVKVYSTISEPNFTQPWANRAQEKASGSGFIISGRRILTNAHVTAWQTSVQVRKHGEATKWTARVVAVSHDVDLAILTVDKDDFWLDAAALADAHATAAAAAAAAATAGTAEEATATTAAAASGGDGGSAKKAKGNRHRSESESSTGGAGAGKGGSRRGSQAPTSIPPTPELSFGALPRLGDNLFVLGYPLSSDTISVTAGVVSRFEFDTYAHSGKDNLTIITDSAINPGNSGGPAINQEGKCVGVAFQGLEGADGIGYCIPVPVIKRFLADVEAHGCATGIASLGASVQSLENESLREAYGMPQHATGVLVTSVISAAKIGKVLQRGDVLLTLDGHTVANDGTISLRGDERVSVGYILTTKLVGDALPMTVLRGSKVVQLTTEVEAVPELVKGEMYDKRPSYIVVAGLLFTVLTRPYLERAFGEFAEPPLKLLVEASEGVPEYEGQEIVVLSEILSNPINIGYEPGEFAGLRLKHLNDTPVRNLVHLAQMLKELLYGPTAAPAPAPADATAAATTPASSSKYLRFVFDDSSTIVLPAAACKKATSEVLSQHAIPAPMSSDVLAAVTATAAAPAAAAAAAAAPPAAVAVSAPSVPVTSGAGAMPVPAAVPEPMPVALPPRTGAEPGAGTQV